MTAPERFDWVWYGVDENGESHVSLGRWQKHPCQFRYKFAEVQPTEHDHTRADPIPAAALAVPEVQALVEAVRVLLTWDHESGRPIPIRHSYPLLHALAALRGEGGT